MAARDTVQLVLRNITLTLRKLGRVPCVLIFLWLVTIWWGERVVFQNSVISCDWDQWETWKSEARPHHVLLVADPQLVDPHTYPGRPWPLSTLTIWYTDLYLRRSYRLLLGSLEPDTTLFLGDLFDGGREWGSANYKSPEARYRGYGEKFWLREYQRFMNIFSKEWHTASMHQRPNEGGRRLISSLPGNHDLGFAGGINMEVKNRFDAHFGPLNRIDVMGNHTFISVDTVSLSAMDQVDPATGSSGAGHVSAAANKASKIWKPVEEFLKDASAIREKTARHYLRSFDSLQESGSLPAHHPRLKPEVIDMESVGPEQHLVQHDSLRVFTNQLPTILISHVPLYRDADTDCGPHRERGNALSISGGYQYQNVLTPLISKDIIEHLDADQITQIYSGDDHDYCEIEHNEFSGRIREITVKSISWAMGVRKPGVQLASLWNPINIDQATGKAGAESFEMPRNTVQNHLCLLPDQLSIFIRYAQALGLTLLILSIRAFFYKPSATQWDSTSPYSPLEKTEPLLPLSRKITPPSSPALHATQAHESQNHSYDSSSSTTSSNSTHLAPTARAGKLGGYGNLPASSRSHSPIKNTASTGTNPIDKLQSYPQDDTDDWGVPLGLKYRRNTHAQPSMMKIYLRQYFPLYISETKMGEFTRSVLHVGTLVFLFYAWILWHEHHSR